MLNGSLLPILQLHLCMSVIGLDGWGIHAAVGVSGAEALHIGGSFTCCYSLLLNLTGAT